MTVDPIDNASWHECFLFVRQMRGLSETMGAMDLRDIARQLRDEHPEEYILFKVRQRLGITT